MFVSHTCHSLFLCWIVRCDDELKVESNGILQLKYDPLFFANTHFNANTCAKCSPKLVNFLHPLLKLTFSFVFLFFNLDSTCHEFWTTENKNKKCLFVLQWFYFCGGLFLHYGFSSMHKCPHCNDIHVDWKPMLIMKVLCIVNMRCWTNWRCLKDLGFHVLSSISFGVSFWQWHLQTMILIFHLAAKQIIRRLRNLQLSTSLMNWCNNLLTPWMKHLLQSQWLKVLKLMVHEKHLRFNLLNYKKIKSLGSHIIKPPLLGHPLCLMIHLQ